MISEIKKQFLTFFVASGIIIYLCYPPATGFTLYSSQGIIALFIIGSSISIVVKTIRILVYFRKKWKEKVTTLLSPVAIICIAIIGVQYLNYVNKQAINFLTNIAETVNTTCNQNGKCPMHPDTWKKYDSRYKYDYIFNKTKFFLYFTSTGDNFNIYLKYGPDVAYHLNGGINKQVSRGWYNAKTP